MAPTISKIRVEAGCITLACRRGTARLPIPVTPRSILADHDLVLESVEDLARIAAPEVPTLEFAFGDDEPTELEFFMASAMTVRSALRRAVWTSRESPHASAVNEPAHEQAVPGPGWQFLGATKRSGVAWFDLTPGQLAVHWKAGTNTIALPSHPRLLISNLTDFRVAIAKAKQQLSIPNGARFEMTLPAAASLLERRAMREAIVDGLRTFGQPEEASTKPSEPWYRLPLLPAAGFVAYLVASLLFGFQPSLMAAVLSMVAFVVACGYFEAWQKDRMKTAKLKSLLQPW